MAEDKTAVHSIKDLLGEAQKKHAAYLIVISARSPASVGRMLKLEKSEFVMGRSPDLSLQVDDDGISRRHCKIAQASNGHFQLVDLGSTNGTYLNGIKVNVATLQDGDKIQIGANTVVSGLRRPFCCSVVMSSSPKPRMCSLFCAASSNVCAERASFCACTSAACAC